MTAADLITAIREAATARDLSLVALADAAGLPYSTTQGILSRRPADVAGLGNVLRLAEAVGLRVDLRPRTKARS